MIRTLPFKEGTSAGSLAALWGTGLVLLAIALAVIFSAGQGTLLLLAISAALGGGLVLLRPDLAVFVLLALLFLEISVPLLGIRYLGIHYLLSALLIIPLSFSILRDRDIRVLHVPQIKIFLAIGALFLMSTWWSHFKYPVTLLPDVDQTVRMLELFFSRMGFLVFFLYFVRSRGKIEIAVWLILALIVAAAASALMAPPEQAKEFHDESQRARAAFSLAENPNRLAFVCVFGTGLLWFFQSYGPPTGWKFVTLPFLLFLPAMALSSGSRSGFLQLLLLAGLAVKEQRNWSVTKRVRSFLFLGSLVLLLMIVVPAGQLIRATSFSQTVSTNPGKSLNSRIHTVSAALEMAASNPILGVGVGNFRWLHRVYYGQNLETHNSYLWALVSGGVGVLGLYLLMFYSTYRMLRKSEIGSPPEILWLVKGLKAGLILFLFFSVSADFWIHLFLYVLVGLAVAVSRLHRAHGRPPQAFRREPLGMAAQYS